MGSRSPWRSPGDSLLDAAIVFLGAVVALSVAIHLLIRIVSWLLVIAGVAVVIWAVVLLVRMRGQRW